MTADLQSAVVRHAAVELTKAAGDREGLRQALQPIQNAGLFDLTLAQDYGGGGAGLTSVTKTLSEVARIDGSVGFLLSQGLLGHMITAGFPPATLFAVHKNGPSRIAGVFAPKGRAVITESGWTVSGTWSLATGAIMSDWLYLQCVAMNKRRVILDNDGRPLSVLVMVRAEQLLINQNWNAPGLQLTASDEVTANRIDVPSAFAGTFSPHGRDSEHAIPILPSDYSDVSGLTIAAVGLGIAQALTDALCALGRSGRRATFSAVPISETPQSQIDAGNAIMFVEAAEALLEKCAGGNLGTTLEGRAKTQATCATVVKLCCMAANLVYESAGKDGLDQTSDIWRRYADLRTLSLHAWCSNARIAPLGAVSMGGAVDPLILPERQR